MILAAALGEKRSFILRAISTIVTAESIDMNVAFRARRYDKGGRRLSHPAMTREESIILSVRARRGAGAKPTARAFRSLRRGMPIVNMADRGERNSAFGPMRAVGLIDPRTGRRVPTRLCNCAKKKPRDTLYNRLDFKPNDLPEQRRVFALIPGLANAEFIVSAACTATPLSCAAASLADPAWRQREDAIFAGQMTGVEGYIESSRYGPARWN